MTSPESDEGAGLAFNDPHTVGVVRVNIGIVRAGDVAACLVCYGRAF